MVSASSVTTNSALEYPDLEKLEFVYDKSKSRKEQAELVLESLLSEFEAKIASAKESREAKLKQRREARRQAEAAAAEVKRKEEERHKNRERLQAEIQEGRQMGKKRLKSQMHCRQEDAAENRRSRRRKPRRRATESGLPRKQEELEEASCGDLSGEEGIETTGKRPSEFAICNKANRTRGYGKSSRHGADFFLPQSREAFAEEDTPTHPKRLLPAFASVDNPVPSMTLASISQNSDRRVHWEDQGDNDDPLVDRVPQKTNEDIGSKTKYDTGASQPTNTMHRRYASGENKGPGDPKLENDHSDGLQGQEPELYPTQERVHSPTSVSRKKKQSDSSKKDSAILNSMRIAPTSQNTKALSPRKGQVHNSSEKKNLQSKYKQVRRTELGLNKLQEGKELEKNDNVHVSSKKRNKLPAEPSRSRERNSRDNLTEPKLSLSKLLQKNWHKGKPRSKAMEGRDTAAIYDSSEILFYHVKKDEKDPLWLSRKSGGASDSGDDLRKFKDGKEGSKQKADRGKANESKSSLRKKSDQKSSGDHRPHKKITKVSGTSDGLQASRKTSPSTKGTGLVSKTRIGNLNKQRNPSKESRVKRKSFDRGSLDSLAAPKQSLGASKRTKRTSSTPRKLGPSSHQESSKGIIASKSRTTTKRPSATRKRKSSDISCTQSLGQSSCEGGSKARRRKKKEATGSQKSSTKSLADDAYDFHF